MSASSAALRITYPSRRAVLASYRLDGPTLSLFVPTAAEVPVGERVQIQVGFADSAQTFVLSGLCTWRRPRSRGMRLEPGLGLAFTGGEKFAPAQMLAYCAGRPLELGTAQDPRTATRIDCKVTLGKHTVSAKIHDISNTGVFIAARALQALRPGRELEVTLDPGWFGLGGKTLRARVVWAGDKAGRPGVGVRFVGQPGEVRPLVKKYLVKRAG